MAILSISFPPLDGAAILFIGGAMMLGAMIGGLQGGWEGVLVGTTIGFTAGVTFSVGTAGRSAADDCGYPRSI